MRDSNSEAPVFFFEEGLEPVFKSKPKGWMIDYLIPSGDSLAGVVGESGSGKSCVVYDIFMHYLTGATTFHGYPMRGDNRNCVLMASEGDFKRRLKGWCIYHGITEKEADQIEGKLLMLDPSKCNRGLALTGDKIKSLIEDIEKKVSSVGLIVIDTLNGFFTGNENDNTNMGDFLGRLVWLAQKFKATVIVIHHTGKQKSNEPGSMPDQKGRGASSFSGKLDQNLNISGKPSTKITIKTTKSREAKEAYHFEATAAVVPVGLDEYGEPADTIVIQSFERKEGNPKPETRDKDIELIQEGITAGLIPVAEDGFIAREDLTAYFTAHGGKEGTGFKGKSGALNQSSSTGAGICERLMKKEALEWLEESEGYLLRDTDSYCWKW